MTEENSNLLLDDGIHITKEAHNILSQILYRKIIGLQENNKETNLIPEGEYLKI